LDETEFSSSVKDEIHRVLYDGLDSTQNINGNEIPSLKDLDSDMDSQKTIVQFQEQKSFKAPSKKEMSSNTFLCFPQNKNPKLDIFLNFVKDFKIYIPNASDEIKFPMGKISIGVNTSKEPSPINGKNMYEVQPNLLQNFLGINNKLITNTPVQIGIMPMSSYFPIEKYYLPPLQNLPYSFTTFTQSPSYYQLPAGDKMMG